MTQAEFINLWQPACNHLFGTRIGETDHNACAALDKFLGVKEFEVYTHTTFRHDKPMEPELRRKVVLLAGPHWRAVLKANNIPIPKVKHDT